MTRTFLRRQGKSTAAGHLKRLRSRKSPTPALVQEESGILPTEVEIERFIQEVDVLRDDVERLEARLRRLEARNPAE